MMVERWPHGRFLQPLFWLICLLAGAGAVAAQSGSGISAPAAGDEVAGVVVVVGTAVHPDYLRYELAFRRQGMPSGEWIVFAEGSQPVADGTLAVWDTTVGRDAGSPVFPDGSYDLRLRVVRTDYNYDEYFTTGLIVNNSGPTPTPTLDATAAARETAAAPTAAADGTPAFSQPTPLPSLTPFPTPTAPLAPERTPTAVAGIDDATNSGGMLGQLGTIDGSRFGRAFLLGAVGAGLLFGLLALYLLLRAVARRLWRAWWAGR